MVDCFTVLVVLDSPESAGHATAVLDHRADLHSAVVCAQPGQPVVTLTLPADNLANAVQTALALIKAAGCWPVRVEAMAAEEFDRR